MIHIGEWKNDKKNGIGKFEWAKNVNSKGFIVFKGFS